mgnify:CR=1 FL=1
MAAEEALGGGAGLAGLLGRGAHEHRPGGGRGEGALVRRGVRIHDVGDDAGDVVGAARLERGPDQLDGREVDRAGAEDVGEPVVVEDAGAAVAAQQQPVALDELDGEEVGVGLVDPVDGAEDEVAVRVRPRLLLGDPALVDEALDERVVLGELLQALVLGHLTVPRRGVRQEDGDQAARLLKERAFQLVITDLNMPGKNGFDILDEVKTNPAYAHIPVIITSTSSTQTIIDKCMDKGAAEYMVKPDTFVEYEPFVQQLYKLVNQKHLVKE